MFELNNKNKLENNLKNYKYSNIFIYKYKIKKGIRFLE